MQILQKSRPFFKNIFPVLLLLLAPLFSRAAEPVPVDDTMLSHGKIYVVVLVISTIFAGIILFLIYLERKINKLEEKSSK